MQNAQELLKEARDELLKADETTTKLAEERDRLKVALDKGAAQIVELEKECASLRDKIGKLELEKAAREVVDQMVEKGVLERDDTDQKVAEILENPERFPTIKEAVSMVGPGSSLLVVGDSLPSIGGDPTNSGQALQQFAAKFMP